MMRKWFGAVLATLSLGCGSVMAGTIVLEGSDASTFHGTQPGGPAYVTQLFSYLKSDSYNSALPVFVLGGHMHGVPADTVYGTTLPDTLFGNYSAVYVQSPGGCCSERPVPLDEQQEIAAFVALGGSVAIQDYEGGLETLLGFDAPQTAIGGIGGGAGGPGCFDSQVFLPAALSKGFTQPPPLGCWGHQAYDLAYFGPLGFVSLVDSGPEFDSLGSGDWSSFLAKGGELGGGGSTDVPVASTVLLTGLGLLGMGAIRRRKN